MNDDPPSPVVGGGDPIPGDAYRLGPARGIVLGLVPAMLAWAVPIALVIKLLKA